MQFHSKSEFFRWSRIQCCNKLRRLLCERATHHTHELEECYQYMNTIIRRGKKYGRVLSWNKQSNVHFNCEFQLFFWCSNHIIHREFMKVNKLVYKSKYFIYIHFQRSTVPRCFPSILFYLELEDLSDHNDSDMFARHITSKLLNDFKHP